MSGFRQRVIQGLLWRSGVAGGQQVTQVLFTILLARLLTTADFGLVAMAFLVTRFVQAISQVQFGAAIIQDENVSEAQVSALFLVNLGINAVMSAACCIAAPLAAHVFNEPRVVPLVAVLSWSLLLASLSFPTVLLRKRMEFGAYSAHELYSMLAGNLLAVAAAFAGMGVWSLVLRLMVQRAVFAVSVWRITGWRPVRPCFTGIGRHVRYGLHLLGSNIFYFASQNLAPILIGRYAGADTLGCFWVAFNLAIVPAQQVQAVFATVLMPAFSLVHGDLAVFRRKAYVSMFALGLVYIPALLGLAAVAKPFVRVAYGASWAPAAGFLTLLAVAGLVKGLEHLMRCVILAAGRSRVVGRVTAFETGWLVLFVVVGGGLGGPDGLVLAYVASALVSGAFTLRVAHDSVGVVALFLR
ncbi:MAG: oligosaccharide flippase family protein, partial [Planctomycetota bacterium]